MEAQYKTANGRVVIKVQGENQKDLFRQLALAQSVFEAETSCGCCNSESIRFLVRTHDGMDFYQLECQGCSAQFSFGQHKGGGTLFPKRRGEDGQELLNRGWRKYKRDGNGEGWSEPSR